MAVPSDPPFDPQELLFHAGWLRRLALDLVPDAAGADDLVQDTFLVALAKAPGARGSRRAWLAKVARNLARQGYRKDAHRRGREELAASPEALPSPADLAQEIEAQNALSAEVMELPEPYRSVLLLRYYRELTTVEIAARCELPPGTVRSQLTRGIALLRERLEQREGGAQRFLSIAAGLLPAPKLAAVQALTGPALPTIAMHITAKIGIAATLTALALVGWKSLGQDPEPAGTEALAMEAPVGPAAPKEDAETSLALLDQAPVQETREVAPAAKTAKAPAEVPVETAAPEEPATGFIEATFVDAAGIPQPEIRFSMRDGSWGGRIGDEVLSNPAGEVRLEVAIEDPEFLVQWQSSAFASGCMQAVLAPGETRSLGTIRLEGRADLAGFVRDASGQPVPGAKVWADGPELTPGFGSPIEGEINAVDRGILQRRGMSDIHGTERFGAIAVTDEHGAYLLAGMAVGKAQRVWARKEGWCYSWSEPVVLAAGERREGFDLTLAPLDKTDRIAGQIVDPDGNPVPTAELTFQLRSAGLGMSSSAEVDDEGRFDIVLWRKVPHMLTASIPDGSLAPFSLPAVEPGSTDLVMQLGGLEDGIKLVVTDGAGLPITAYRILVTQITDAGSFSRIQTGREHEDGKAIVNAPAGTFEVTVTSEGYAKTVAGPFEGGIVPGNKIELTLAALPGVRGVVLAGGKPIEGASVRLYRVLEGDDRMTINGFLTRVHSGLSAQPTGSDGAFQVYPDAPGNYVLAATMEGWGRAELEPMWLSTTELSEGHRLKLPRPGSLRVRVVREDGSDPGGTLVGLNRYDGHPSTHVADAGGFVLVEGLTPGGWAVTQADAEISPSTNSSSTWRARDGEVPEWPVQCQVHSGQQTEYELRVAVD